MENIKIAHIKINQSSKGLIVSDVVKNKPYYQFQKGSSMTIVPTMAYCPHCSGTHEYRGNSVIPKWALEVSDLEFRLNYKIDEAGNTYASCTSCKGDLREELLIEDFLEPKIEIPTLREIFIKGIYYQNGYYWLKKQDFKSVMIQHREGVKVQICFIHTNGDVKRMKNEAFSNAKNLLMKEDSIGVKSNMWE